MDLVRAIVDQADFEELFLKVDKPEVDTPLDLIIKEKDDDDQFVFSVQLLRKIKERQKFTNSNLTNQLLRVYAKETIRIYCK